MTITLYLGELRMKVLWIVSFKLPFICKYYNYPVVYTGGWISSMLESLKKNSNIEIGICYLNNSLIKSTYDVIEGIACFGVSNKKKTFNKDLKKIINDFNPDIMHIWGAEVDLSYPAIRAFNKPNRTIIHMQGCLGFLLSNFYGNLPKYVRYGFSFGELIRRNNLFFIKKIYEKKSKIENESIKNVNHIIGRTHFDRNFALT